MRAAAHAFAGMTRDVVPPPPPSSRSSRASATSSGICRSSAPSRRRTPGGAVTFLTLPSTRAKELLQAEPCVGEVIYFEHHGSEFARGCQSRAPRRAVARAQVQARLDSRPHDPPGARRAACRHSGAHRAGRRRAALAHHQCGHRRAPFPRDRDRLAARVAGVDERAGALDRARPEAAGRAARRRSRSAMRRRPRPWIVLGLGGSHPEKDWPDDALGGFLDTLRRRATGTVFLIGGARQRGARRRADRALGGRAARSMPAISRSSRRPRCCASPICSSARIPAR